MLGLCFVVIMVGFCEGEFFYLHGTILYYNLPQVETHIRGN